MVQQRQRQTVEITPAKGRPFLHWVGKKPLERVTAFPAQLVETFDPSPRLRAGPTGEPGEGNLLFHGDNKEVLAYLLANGYRGKVNLIYIDPPFDSGADYVRKVSLRGASSTAKVDGETYTHGEQIQYTDIWANDNYLQFMYERLMVLKELLAETGSVFLHCDYRKAHHLRCLMDEVFGPENLQNEIVWFFPGGGDSEKQFNRNHNTILFYAKGERWTFNYKDVLIPYSKEQVERFKEKDEKGRFYWNVNPRGERSKTYAKEGIGEYDVWTIGINASEVQTYGYPTLKPTKLLERIVRACSKVDDVVLDCFIGSGTTAAVAQKLGRRWIGCDINKGAIQTTSKRLQTIILEQAQQQARLVPDAVKPASLAFSIYRVNDYDLQIQHNEAINLACEHIGVTRTRSDAFFDGTMGRRLVKIIPLTHPLTLLDLQLLQDELKNRPQEDRDIVIVCLGKETAVDPEVEQWNKKRPVARIDAQGRPIAWQNKIEVIELRTDKRYGKFFVHQPARALVDIRRENGRISVEIQDFISPTIIERLNMDQSLFNAQITDWRAMVDCVMVDTAYDGQVFNIALSDVPPKKSDLVTGHYELLAPDGPTTVGVKIVDMLGEEVLVTADV